MLPRITMAGACVEFPGKKRPDGYGVKYVGFENGRRVTMLAHRWMWECENGQIPEGMFVCHSCDNPSCWRIEHLFLGTHEDNMRDASEKGRTRNQNSDISVCQRGHSDFVLKSDGKRYCRPCQRMRDKAYRERSKSASHHSR